MDPTFHFFDEDSCDTEKGIFWSPFCSVSHKHLTFFADKNRVEMNLPQQDLSSQPRNYYQTRIILAGATYVVQYLILPVVTRRRVGSSSAPGFIGGGSKDSILDSLASNPQCSAFFDSADQLVAAQPPADRTCPSRPAQDTTCGGTQVAFLDVNVTREARSLLGSSYTTNIFVGNCDKTFQLRRNDSRPWPELGNGDCVVNNGDTVRFGNADPLIPKQIFCDLGKSDEKKKVCLSIRRQEICLEYRCDRVCNDI